MDKSLDDIEFGAHASVRLQQRGIKKSVAETIIRYADREIRVGRGLVSVSVSKRCAIQLGEKGVLDPKVVEKITSKSVIVSNDNHAIKVVTVMHVKAGKVGRHHRKYVKRGWN
tara:strand:+ start:156 stop:494 length:339 start_codon:yes stop_codon:yes gene_type:complete